jgi:hypothetical protein
MLRLLAVSAACALSIGLVGCAHHHPDYDDHYEWRERRGHWEDRRPHRGDWDRHWERRGRWDDRCD